jgi:hypothetical protein
MKNIKLMKRGRVFPKTIFHVLHVLDGSRLCEWFLGEGEGDEGD